MEKHFSRKFSKENQDSGRKNELMIQKVIFIMQTMFRSSWIGHFPDLMKIAGIAGKNSSDTSFLQRASTDSLPSLHSTENDDCNRDSGKRIPHPVLPKARDRRDKPICHPFAVNFLFVKGDFS